MQSDFVHLHNHSEYSLLDGACRIKQLVRQAKELNMPAVALTDHGVLYGAMDFYREAVKAGIKPIIGCEVYVSPRTRWDKEAKVDDNYYHLILLCKDEQGYKNLIQMVSRSYIEGFYYKPRVDRELLEQYSSGLIALSGCIIGEIPTLLLKGQYTEALQTALYYQALFGSGNFYLELQNHGIEAEVQAIEQLLRLSRETGIPAVATNDTHYLKKDDAMVHDVLLCIQTAANINDENRMRFYGSEFYLKSTEEMIRLFAHCPETISNSLVISDKCNLDFSFGAFHLPRFPLPGNFTPETFLDDLVWKNFTHKYPAPDKAITERLVFELQVIKDMGFAGYFLIVEDLVNWAKNNGIAVGPGRGSAAGSLVSYVLGITTIDPIKYGLLFERFLNPERVSMPDIDIDFCFEKRDRVIGYIIERYGHENVAQIITFGTMAARAAIRDVGRALDVPYGEVDRIAKMIPAELGISIERALELSADLIQAYENDFNTKRIIDIARAIEGMPRHASIHAAGVVIGDAKLSTLLPLQKTVEGHVVTQYSKETVEDIGLLKMDILGLRTLTVLEQAVDIIAKTHGHHILLEQLPLDDDSVYALLSRGDTIGVFQLESNGLRRILTELKPNCFEDIIAVIALYRPGPLGSGMVEDFINCKHGRQKIHYPHFSLEPILRETYGVILYQEQVMQIAGELADFTMGEADGLRRAMGKKKPEEIKAQRDKFIQGALGHDIAPEISSHLFDLMESFAGYGFNKSHSAAYALISYQTAYLKTYYPIEYMCAFLSSVIDNQDRVVYYIKECKRLKIPILPPDINESFAAFTVTSGGIRFGLGAIKNVGINAVKNIIEARKEGEFTSLFDFCRRVDLGQINKRVIENLVTAGCFDSMDMTRNQALSIVEQCFVLSIQLKNAQSSSQLSLFGEAEMMVEEPRIEIQGEMPLLEKLTREKEVLGFFVSQNPLDQYRDILPLIATHEINDLNTEDEDAYVRVAGIIVNISRKISKKGDTYARFFLEDDSGRMEMILFPAAYRQNTENLRADQSAVIEGFFDMKDEIPKISVRRISNIPAELQELHIRIPEGRQDDQNKSRLLDLLNKYKGELDVFLHLKGRKPLLLHDKFRAAPAIELKRELIALYGKNNLWFQ